MGEPALRAGAPHHSEFYVCVCVCLHTYMYIYIHTYIHTYTHTYIHTTLSTGSYGAGARVYVG